MKNLLSAISSTKNYLSSSFNQQFSSASKFSQFCRFDPLKQLDNYQPNFTNDKKPNYEISTLSNGVKVLTESEIIPQQIDLSVLVGVGTRDETKNNSGSLNIIKNNILKTTSDQTGLLTQQKLLQFGNILQMDYDQETCYFKLQSLHKNIDKSLELLLKSACENKDFLAEGDNVKDYFPEQEYAMTDYIFSHAFSQKNIGMPLLGLLEERQKLSNKIVKKFFNENFTYDKITICAAGIKNHSKFVQLVEKQLSKQQPLQKLSKKKREKSEYKGGELKINTQNLEMEMGLYFKADPWNSKDLQIYNVIASILGNANAFSSGGPGKGMHARTTKYLMNRNFFISSASAINFHFSDNGLFGLQGTGHASQGSQLALEFANQLKLLTEPIPQIEFKRAKNILLSQLFLVLERQEARLEEAAKNMLFFGKVRFPNYKEEIESITPQDINEVMYKTLKNSNAGLVAIGQNAKQIIGIKELQKYILKNLQ